MDGVRLTVFLLTSKLITVQLANWLIKELTQSVKNVARCRFRELSDSASLAKSGSSFRSESKGFSKPQVLGRPLFILQFYVFCALNGYC